MSEAEDFGGRLRELRAASGMTLRALAEAAGVTPDALVKLERGDRKPTWETVLALAKALGVDCTAFTKRPAPATRTAPPDEVSAEPKKPKRKPRGKSK